MSSLRTGSVAAVLLGCTLLSAAAAEKGKVLFSDPFHGRLGPGWSWVREDPKGWRVEQGALVVKTSLGGLWMKHNSTQNLLLRKVPQVKKGDRLAVEVQVESGPSNAFEHAGLVWYYDDDNYAVVLKEKVGDKVIAQLVYEKEGRPRVGFAEKPYDGKTVWLRMEVAGDKLKGLFRATDKDRWQVLGQCDLPVKGEARVGLITGYAPKKAEHFARFSNFRILEVAD